MPDLGNAVYAVLERPRRVWAVGPIHGDRVRLSALHEALLQDIRRGDRLVYLGNFMGVGADVRGVLNELLSFRSLLLTGRGMEPWDIAYLRGTQEEMWDKLLQVQFAANPHAVMKWMLEQGLGATLDAYGSSSEEGLQRCREGTISLTRWTNKLRQAVRDRPGHDELLSSVRRYAVTDNHRLLFVHADINPSRGLADQGDTFWWGGGHLERMTQRYANFSLIIRGASRNPQNSPEMTDYYACIDGSSNTEGGSLTAACFTPKGDADAWLEV